MKVRIWFVIGILAAGTIPASAQQQSPNEQALSAKLIQEIQGSLNCSANLISVQADLAKVNARIKELEPKPEEKK